MLNFKPKKNIIWDFDGVLVDSMEIRAQGFVAVLDGYPKKEIDKILEYHSKNGGLSRYTKFGHFFKNIRNEEVLDAKVLELAAEYSKIMRKKMLEKPILIEDSLSFVKANYNKYHMHIVSGSDGKELQYLCKKLNIWRFFASILGSPTTKIENVKDLLKDYDYKKHETILIGDSINDYEAAKINEIDFYGYNSVGLKEMVSNYIDSFN